MSFSLATLLYYVFVRGYGTLGYETKDEVMEWMLDIQLGRRNLSPIQRIAVAEKYRPIYERQAKENQRKAGIEFGNGGTKLPQKIGEASIEKKQAKDREVNSQLAKIANVNPETYRQAKRVLDSDDEELKTRVLSGKTSISAGYKEIREKAQSFKTVCRKSVLCALLRQNGNSAHMSLLLIRSGATLDI